ncbi:MAG: sigma-54 dependent transcriptional regulator [Gammaproteobacteria bacterium]
MSATKKTPAIKILVVDDDEDILNLLEKWLVDLDYCVKRAASGLEALQLVSTFVPDLVITDLFMEGMDGMALLNEIHTDNPLLPVIMLSGQAQIPDAVKAMHLGVSEFLTKPVEKQKLLQTVKDNIPCTRGPEKLSQFSGSIVFESKVMADVMEMAALVAETDVSVLVTGPTGSGKEVIARAIHDASKRRDKPFIAVNCGAIPEQLLESELFGHEKGAFTGASLKHEGLFQAANGGTIFLDEIGDMPLPLQVKLLRVLQDFEVRPVGATRTFPIDVRLISATHRNLEQAVADGDFREDLYYRLKVVPLDIPDLMDRPDDIPALVDHFLERFARQNKTEKKSFSADSMKYLGKMTWPGNVRQLINVVELCATLSKSKTIALGLVKKAIQEKPVEIQTLKEAKQDFEKKYLISVMRISHGQVANAARIAGRNRTEFYKLLNQYNIDPDDFRNKNTSG